jgi:hypothetical protein
MTSFSHASGQQISRIRYTVHFHVDKIITYLRARLEGFNNTIPFLNISNSFENSRPLPEHQTEHNTAIIQRITEPRPGIITHCSHDHVPAISALTSRMSGKVTSHFPINKKSASSSPFGCSVLNTATLPPRALTCDAKPAAGCT